MLHRRLLYDDRRGVAEPLNETACGCRNCHCDGLIVRGTHLLTFEVRRMYHMSVDAATGFLVWWAVLSFWAALHSGVQHPPV